MSISVASDDDDDGEAVRIDKIFLKSRGSACCSLFFLNRKEKILYTQVETE